MSRTKSSSTMEQKLSCRDWIVMVTLPCILMMSSYSKFNLGGLVPLFQSEFSLTDSQSALIQTSNSISHGLAFIAMWLFGDFLPKKPSFLISLFCWILFNFASVMVTADQYWLFLILRSLDSMIGEVFRIFITIIQADHFSGKYLTAALTANIVCESISVLACSTINSIFVANDGGWRIPLSIAPTLAIPLLISSAIFLRPDKRPTIPHPVSILRNAVGVLRIPSYLLMVISQCVTMIYSISLAFWLPSMMLYAYETLPNVYAGLSYPVISSIMSFAGFAGMIVAAFLVPYANHSLESGSSLFRWFSSTMLAIPIVYVACSGLETLSYISEMKAISTSFAVFVVMCFIDGLGGCGITLNNQQITLNAVPTSQRASAFALHKLIIAFGNLPSAQIIGAISDFFRGKSTDPADRLQAFQKTFLYTWFMPVMSTLMCLLILRFYHKDVLRAKLIDHKYTEETTPLIREKSPKSDEL